VTSRARIAAVVCCALAALAAAVVVGLARHGTPAGTPVSPRPAASPAPSPASKAAPRPAGSPAHFTERVVARGLANPWEMTYGPDGYLWVTQKTSGEITRVNPSDGTQHTLLKIPDVKANRGTQDGLLGMALHPELGHGDTDQYVYVAYSYDADASPSGLQLRMKIRRYRYARDTDTLVAPRDLVSGLPASTDHNSGRLLVGPDRKLYYTIGDQGNNQLGRFCTPIQAQRLPTSEEVRSKDWVAYQGKVLRMNLDGSIPDDNPRLRGVRSHIWTLGHRNAQGIAFGPSGLLYSSEQGPKTDDEVNILRSGGNYGWPRVVGYRDDKAYVYADWSSTPRCSSLTYSDFEIPGSVPTRREDSFTTERFVPPIATLYTVGNDYNFRQDKCADSKTYFICWPTVAPASIDVYTSGAIPGWKGSLLLPGLKSGSVFRLKLSSGGRKVVGQPEELWRSVNRYRDVAISPDGRTIYIATDAAGVARGQDGRPTSRLDDPASILAFELRR
jgi:PQQ-dependent dehydrogenase (s-GDH family)